MTVREALGYAKEELEGAGIFEAAMDAKYLLMEVAGLSSAEIGRASCRERV